MSNIQKSLMGIHLPLFLTQLLFSTIPVFSKLAFTHFNPESVVFFRIFGSAIVFLLLYMTIFREKVHRKKDLLHFAVFGFFGVLGNQYFFVKGVSYTLSINASILITTIPIFTVVFALIGKKEEISLVKILGVIIALMGAGTIIGFEKLDFTGYLKGNLMILLNSAFFAFYLVISKPMLKKYRPFTVITWMYLFSTLGALPLTLKQVLAVPYASIPFKGYLPLLGVVYLGTAIPYMVNKLILQKTASSIVAIYTYVQPVAGTILAVIFLSESPSTTMVLSTALILIGVTLVSFHRSIALPNLFQFKPTFKK
ncbi:DMT family transporter [bacterium]|nr:DMT family transporter [bacterium]